MNTVPPLSHPAAADRDSLQRHVRQLEDLEEIRQLKANYCRWSDRGYVGAGDSPRRVAELFADDGAWGAAHGRDAIERLFREFQVALPLAVHVASNPQIEINGDLARCRWWAVIPSRSADGATTLTVGTYDDELIRTPDGWRFSRIRFTAARREALKLAHSAVGSARVQPRR